MGDLFGSLSNLHLGDCVDTLRAMPANSVDSIVTDPPYGLSAEPDMLEVLQHWLAGDDYVHKGSGFMGKSWDSFVPGPTIWREALRVLKPGGHLVSFFGTRTYDMGALAIRIAGFEIRDQLAWVYGSGFPKSHDVSKAIDKSLERMGMFGPFALHYAERRKAAGLTHNAICEAGKFYAEHNHGGASTNWEKGNNVPTKAQWEILQSLMGLSDGWLPLIERVEAEREVVGQQSGTLLAVAPGQENDRSATSLNITAPATPEAQQWEGWGTALKPAWEPIVLARKPFPTTVAANVLQHGTGAINIDGCRVPTEEINTSESYEYLGDNGNSMGAASLRLRQSGGGATSTLGRFPANILHDGEQFGENGRYFYSPKASKKDRGDGNTHPTVKPTELMVYLCRLVTPPGGVVLDPFMGSGSTGKAAKSEGFRFIGIEREPEYFEIAQRRAA